MFELTASPIDAAALSVRLSRPEAGALVIFEGRVRNHHLGAPVTHLEYEAFDDLAWSEGAGIVEEVQLLYPGVTVLCVHRTGVLRIGETALWIGVASAHRQAGYAACRHAVEEIKRRLPVWKKEHHPDGAAEWVNCSVESTQGVEDDYHARHEALAEIGSAGLARLKSARVLIVGLGGLGCPASLYLAGSGIGHLTLVEHGRIESSNLPRQVLFTARDVGASKALVAAARLRAQNPALEIAFHDAEFSARNARTLVAGHDVVLDGTDNFSTRFLLYDTCMELGVPLVSAAVHRFEGTLDVFRRGTGGCLHDLWPERAALELAAASNCDTSPVFSPAVGVLGVMQAAEALKVLLGLEGKAAERTQLVNLLDGTSQSIIRPNRPECPTCCRLGSRTHDETDPLGQEAGLFVARDQLNLRGDNLRILHLTEPGEQVTAGRWAVSGYALDEIRRAASLGPLVLSCRRGVRSANMARLLRSEGYSGVFALLGSMPAASGRHPA